MADDLARLNPLSKQQMKILRLVACGDTNRVVAQKLYLSEHTAKTHVSRMLKAWDVSSRSELVATAHRIGVLGCANCEARGEASAAVRTHAAAVTALTEAASAALQQIADALAIFVKETGGGHHG